VRPSQPAHVVTRILAHPCERLPLKQVTTKRKRQAAGGEGGGDAAPGAPILSRSRSTVKRTEDERAERLRLKAARRHKREVRLKSAFRCLPETLWFF